MIALFHLENILKIYFIHSGWVSVQFSHSVMYNSLWQHGLQLAKLLCPSTTPRTCSNSCPLSWWCHPATSSPVVQFSCFPSCPGLGSFPISQFFASGGHIIGVSFSASVFPINIQDWFPLGLTGWISLQSKGLHQSSSPAPEFKSINCSVFSFL